MKRALAYSLHALEAAAELDFDGSDEDRSFFGDEKAALAKLLDALIAHGRAIEDYDLTAGSRMQMRVELGDYVLDRGVTDGNARMKLALKGKAGLGAAHVFGERVASLTKEKLALEPQKVLLAVERMKDVPDFAERAAIAADLTKRANQQQACLDERAVGRSARAGLASLAIRLVLDAAHALASLKGTLDARFPRQREYVAVFFFDAGHKAKAAHAATDLEAVDATEVAPG
jgi:hypothetical protein